MQYVECTFKPGGRRCTYHNDGDPVKVGDRVFVDGRDGKSKVEVVGIVDQKPPFQTKPIGEKVPPPDESVVENAG